MLLLLVPLMLGLVAVMAVIARPLSRRRVLALVSTCVACMALAGLIGAALGSLSAVYSAAYLRARSMQLIAFTDRALQAGEFERVAEVFAEAHAQRDSGESWNAIIDRAVWALEQSVR